VLGGVLCVIFALASFLLDWDSNSFVVRMLLFVWWFCFSFGVDVELIGLSVLEALSVSLVMAYDEMGLFM